VVKNNQTQQKHDSMIQCTTKSYFYCTNEGVKNKNNKDKIMMYDV